MTLLAFFFAACAGWLAMRPPVRMRTPPEPRIAPAEPVRPAVIHAATALAALGAFTFLGGWIGLIAALVVWILASAAWARVINRTDDERAFIRDVAPIADMLAAAASAGVHVDVALRAIADAVEEPTARSLRAIVHARALGASAAEAWARCPRPLQPIGDAMVRTERSGAGLVDVLHGVADDARRAHRTQVEIAARTAGVRAVAPLAACFLPAFLLVGVLPVVVSLLDDFAW